MHQPRHRSSASGPPGRHRVLQPESNLGSASRPRSHGDAATPRHLSTHPPQWSSPHHRDSFGPHAASPSSSSSSLSLLDISRPHPQTRGIGGFLGALFRPSPDRPSRRRLQRPRSRSSTKRRILYFGNSSSSSLNSDLAYGYGYIPRPRSRNFSPRASTDSFSHHRNSQAQHHHRQRHHRQHHHQYPSHPHQPQHHHQHTPSYTVHSSSPSVPRPSTTDDEILHIGHQLSNISQRHNLQEPHAHAPSHSGGLMATAAAAMRSALIRDNRSRTSRQSNRRAAGSRLRRGSSSDGSDWESLSEDESSIDDAPSDLAYGPSAPRAAPPQPLPPMSTALASTASRWSGSRESGSVVDPRLFGPVNSLRGLVTPRPSDNESAEANAQYKNFNRLRRVETDAVPVTAPVAPLKHMFPVPTSDPSKFEADAASSVSSRQDSCLVARQDHQPILRHPAPKTPVSSQVFKTDPLQRAPSKPADFDGAFGQAAIGAIAGAAWDYSRRDGGEALEECSHQGRDSRREQRREERRREERRDEQQHERRDEDELREQRRQERREERREQRRDERRDDKKQNESDHSGPRSSRNLGDDERRHHDRRSEKSDKHEKDPKQSQRELDRDRGRRKAKRDSYSSKNTDNASHKPSSHRGDESIISRSSHATAGFRDDQVGKSYSRQGIQVEVDPQEFDESASRSARKESRRSKDRHEHRETRENENDKPFGANDSSQPISQSAAIDPFQYLIHDDVSYSRQAATASEEKPMATGALNRQADSSHCRQAEPAATFATDEALSQWRVHDQDTHGDLREHRGPLHNHVQQDANRYYRQAAKARKINQEGYNSSHGAAKTSVVDADKWHSENNDRPRIVTPPEVEYRQHDISSNPYGAPDADVRLDNKMFPQDAHTFKARSHGLGAPDLSRRDPCCERDRPMLNLVFPTPEASRRATPSPEQLRGNAKEDDTRQQDQGDCWSRHHDVYDYASAATEPGDDTALPPSTPKSVSWGENSTKRFEVESPEHKSDAENSRDRVRPRLDTSSQWGILAQAISGSSPEPDNEPRVMDTGRVLGEPLADRGEAHSADSRASEPANDPKYISPEHGKMPGGFTDDIAFAATLAAGLQDTGFDPNLVLNDPHYHRRDSPPGEGEAKGDGWDQQSCTDAAAASTAWDSPRHKPLPESRQESVVDDTDMPAGEPSEKPYAAGSVPEPPLQLSKKERRKLEKAKRQLANSSTTATADSSEVASIVDGSETQRELSKEEQRQLDREAILGDSVRNDGHGWRGGDEKKSEKRSKKSGRSGEGSNRGSGSHESPSVFGAPSEVSVGSSGKRSSKSKRGSGTQDDLDDYGHDPPGQHSRHVFEERDVSSVVSEPRSSEYRRDSKGKKRSTRYEDDDAKSVASAPGSSRKGKDAEKRSSGLFSGIFKSGGSKEEHKKESFLANADIFGADVGTAVSAPLESSSGSPKATQSSLSYPASDYEHEHNFHKHGNYKRRDSDVVARAVKPSIDPQYGDLLLLPPSKPGSPQDFPTDLPSLPESGPSTPVEERHNMMLAHRRHRSAQETPPKTPSTTAIPISWRRSQRNTPTRPGFDLKSPLKSPLTSPIGGHESAARRPARHASWDRNREIQPLFLVEHARHYSADAFAHAASLSELPPSEPSSRASSVPAEQHETAMDTIASHADDEPRGLQIDTDLAAAALPEDVAGSQETTPRAGKQMEPETELPALPGSTNGEDDGGYSCASPDPVESMSKDRSSYLLHSSPPSDKSGRYAGGTWEPSSVQGMEATTALADELEHDFTSADEHFSDALEGQHDPMSDSGADDVVERHHLPHGVGETEQVLEEATAEHAKPLTWDVGAEDAEMSTEVTERHSASAVPEVATMEPPIQETVTKTTPRPTVAEGIEILTRDSVSNTAKEFKPVERETFESPVSEVPFSDTEPLKNTITSSLPAATESSSQEGEDEAVYSMATRGPEQLTQDDATEFKGISCPGTLPIGLEPDVDAMTILAAVEADKLAHEAARGEAENSSLPQTSPDKFVPSMNPRLPYPVSPAAQDDPESAHAIADSSRNQVAADTIVSVATEDAEPPEWSNMSANARKKARRARRALGLGIAETVAAAATSSLSPDSLTDQGTTSSQPEPSQEESDKTRKGKKKRNKGKKKSPSPDEDAQQVLVASDAGREVSAAATEVLDARSSITKEHVPEESALTTYPLDQLGGDESTAAVVTDKVPKDSAKIEAGTRNDTVVKDAESQGQTLCSRDGSRDPETFDVPLESAKPAGKTNKDETSPTSKESGNQVQGDDILDMGESKKDDATSANFKKGKKKRKDRKKKEIQNQPLTDESASVQSEVDTTLATASQPDHTAYSLLKDMTNEAKPKTFRKECIETVQEHSVGGNQLSRNTARQEDEDTGPASVSEEILAIPVAINAARDSVQQHIPEAFFDTDPRAAPEQVETIHAITVDDDVSLPREAAEKSPVEAEAAADDIDVTAELPAPEDVSESLADAAVDLIEGSLFKTGRDIRDMTEEPPSHPSEQDICDAPERSESVTVQEEPSREPQEPGTKESLELVSETSNATFPVEQEPQRHESPKVFLSRVINEDVSISSDDKRVVETPRSVFSETANDAESGLKIPQDPSAQTADQSFNHEARQLHGETLEDAQRVFNTGIDATSAERIGASELNETMTDSTQVKRVEIPPDIAIQDVANVVLDTARELPLESATEPELFERLQNADKYCTETLGKPWARSDAIDASSNSQGSAAETAKDVNNDIDHGIAEPLKDKTHDAEFPEIQAVNDPEDRKRSFYPSSPNLHVAASHFDLASETPVYSPSASRLLPATAFALALIPIKPCDLAREGSGASGIVETPEHSAKVQHKDTVQESDKSDDYQALEPTLCPLVVVEQRFAEDAGKSEQDIVGKPTFEFKDQSQNHQYLIENAPKPNFASPDEVQDEVDEIQSQGLDDIEQSDIKKGPVADLDLGQDKVKKEQSDAVVAEPVDKTLADTFHYEPPASFNANLSGENDKSLEHDTDGAIDAKVEKEEEEEEEEEGPLLVRPTIPPNKEEKEATEQDPATAAQQPSSSIATGDEEALHEEPFSATNMATKAMALDEYPEALERSTGALASCTDKTVADDPQGAREIEMRQTLDAAAIELPQSPSPSCLDDAETELPQSPVPSFLNAAEVELPQSPAPSRPATPETTPLIGTKVEEGNMLLTLCSESTVEKPSSNMENVDDSACAHSNELELQAKPTQEPILITKQDASLKADTGYSALQKISEDILPETGINCGVDSADNTAPENTLNLGESNAIQGPAAKEVVTVLAKLSKKERRRRRKLEAAFEALSTDLPETRIASEVESDPAHASPSVAPEQIEEKGAKGQVDEVPNDSFNAKEGASSATIISENAGVSVDSSSGQPIDGSEANTDEEWTESTSKIESKKKKRKKKKGKTLMPLSSESMVPEIAKLLESDARKSSGKSQNVKSAETVTFDTANSSMSTQSQAATMNQDDQQATLERTVSGDAATKLATDLEAQVAPHSASVVPNLNDEQILNLEASGTTGELPETCNRETTVFDGEASRQELGMDPLALTSELTMQPEDKTEVVGTAQLPSGDLEPQIGKQATCKDLDHSVKSIERHEMDKDALVEPVKETDLMKATMVDMDSPAVEEVKDHADGLEGGGHDDIFIRKMLESKSLETAQPLEHVPSKTKIQEEDSRSETLPESIPLPPQDATELSTLNQASESLVADGTKSFETEADSQHGKLEGQEQKLPQRKLSKKERRLLKKISGLGQRSTEAKQEATSLVEKSESAPDPNQASAAPEVSSASDIDSDAKQEVASEEQKGTDEKQDMCSSQESKKEEEQALDEALAPLTLSDGTLGVSTSLANEVEKDQSSRLQDLDAQAGEKESVGVLESESCGIQSAEDISEPAANAEEIALQTPLPVSKDLELESLAEEDSKAAERQFQFAAEECKTAADQKDQSPIDLPLPVSEEEETRLVAEQEVKSEARQSSKCAMDTKINAAEDEEDQIALQTRLPHSDAEAEKRQMAPVDDGFEAALQVEPESHKPLQSSLGGETFQGASAVAATMHKSPADADFAPVAREKSQDGLFEGDAGFEAPIAATEPDSSSFGQQVIATRPHSRVAAEQGDKEHEADSSIICPISKSPEVVDSDDLSEAVACEAAPTDSEAAALAKRLAQVADQYRSSAQMEQETSHGEAVRESRRKPGSMPTQAGRVTADNFWTMLSNSKRRKDAKKTMDSQAVQAADPIMSRSSGVGPMEQLIDEAFLTGHQLLSQGEHVASMDDDASASPAIDSGPTAKPAEDDDLEANLFSVAAPTQAPDAGVDSGSDAKPHVSATQESGASFEAVSVQGMSRAARKKAKKKEKKRGLSTGSSSQVEAPVMETPIPSSREPERQVSGADKDVAAGGNKNDAGADADADAEKCAVVAGGGGGGVGGDVANEVATVHDDEAGTRGKVATGRDGEAGAEAEVVPGQDDATGQEAPVEMSPEDDVDAKTTVAMGQDAHDTLNRSAASSGVALLAERFGGGIKRRKKSTGNKIVDKRQAHQVDLFDDAALWEGAGKKSLQPNRDDEADIAFWDAEASRARAEATGADEGHEQTVGHQGMAASRAPWHDGKDKEDVNARAEHQTADQEATATEAESRPRDQEATAAAGASSPTVDQKITTIEVASPTADQDAMAIEPQSPTLCRAFSTNTECPTGNQEAEMLTSGGEAMAIKAESSAVDQAVVTEAESPNVNQVIAEPKSPEAEQNVAIINREASIAPVEPRMADQEALVAETANPEADQEAIIAQIESYMADPSTIVTEAEDLTVKQDEPEPSPLLQKGPEVPEPVGGLLREMEDTEDNNASSETRQSATGALPVVQEVPEAEEVDENSSSGVTGAILSRHGTPVLERRRATPTKRSQESHGDLSAGQDSVMMAAATALAASRLQADRSSSDVGEGQGWAVGPRAMSAPGAGPASTPGPAPHRSASNSSLARGVASPAASTPPPPPPPQLRRADKRMSGDLRAMRQQSSTTPHHHQQQAQLELQQQQPQQPCASAPPSSPSPPVANEGRPRKEPAAADAREKEMADVYDGYGQGRIGSPRSPTRPHSVRRRQSMQVLELESRVEQLLAENRQLADARAAAETSNNQRAVATAALAERNAEIDSLKQSLLFVNNEVARLREINDGLTSANAQLASKDNSTRYADLEVRHDSLSRQLDEARGVHNAVSQTLTEKDAEIAQLHAELDMAKTQIQEMQRRILDSKATDADFLALRDDDYIENRCQMLFSHVQQWVLRFSKFSDMRPCRLTGQVGDDKTIERLDNAVLDGSDVDTYLNDRVRRRDVFLSVTMNMIWEFVFTRYLFGMDREQRQKLKSLEKLLADVGPVHAVRQWRAVTLTLLSRRDSFKTQRELDTEAVVQAIFQTLSSVLPPPSNLEAQIQAQLRRVVAEAVDLSVEMRLQRAEYMMLPPLQPEYDSKGDLTSTVLFDASMMNERGAAMALASNQELEARAAVVRVVLFPIVIKKGDQEGLGDDKIVVYPAQVLTAHDAKAAKRNFASASSDAGGASLGFPSHISVVTETMSHPEAA